MPLAEDAMAPTCWIGLDVAKDAVVMAVAGTAGTTTFATTAEGLAGLVATLRQRAPTAIVVEASGGYERPCVAACVTAHLPVVVVNPRQVRDFARALGKLAKTDRSEYALFEVQGSNIRADQFEALAVKDSLLEISGLSAGDYELHQKLTGERIRIRVVDGVQQTVRYLGLDVPTGDACYAGEATEANQSLVAGQTVIIERQSTDVDARGNWVRDVWVTNEAGQPVLVSQQLIAQGAAEVKVSDPNTRFAGWLEQTEAGAQADGTGLWSACGE